MRAFFIALGLAVVVCVGSYANADFITIDAYRPGANDPETSKKAELAELTIAAEEAERFTAAFNDGLGNAMPEYLSLCKKCEFSVEAKAAIASLQEEMELGVIEGMNEAMNKQFELTVCNKSSKEVYVAVVGIPDPILKLWVSQGWWQIPSGQCNPVSSFNKGPFFITVDGNSDTWPKETRINLCTPHKAHTRVSAGDGCLEDEANDIWQVQRDRELYSDYQTVIQHINLSSFRM